MRIELLTKNYSPSEKLKDIVRRKIDRLDKFFDEDTKVKVMMKQANDVYTMELTIMVDKAVLRSEVSSDNMYDNIDTALPKLEKQIIRHRKKLSDKTKKFKEQVAASEAANTEDRERRIVRSKVYALTPMTVEDAIEELELIGHSFFVFYNREDSNVNVIYRRNDGDYGLIETTI